MATESFQTLADGTLIDYHHDHDKGRLVVMAGKSLHPGERPTVLVLKLDDARQMGLHLAAFVATMEAVVGGTS